MCTVLMEFAVCCHAKLSSSHSPPPPPSLPLSLFLLFLIFTGTQAVDLEVDESSFTGETIPSRKSTLPQVNLNQTAHAYN